MSKLGTFNMIFSIRTYNLPKTLVGFRYINPPDGKLVDRLKRYIKESKIHGFSNFPNFLAR